MVENFKKIIFPILVAIICSMNGCSNDLFGIFASSGLKDRWETRNVFKFLTPDNRLPDNSASPFGDKYSFIVVGDTHIQDGDVSNLKKLKPVIDNSGGEIKFVVFCGDVTQNGKTEDINKFKTLATEYSVPCYPVIGNHDIYFNTWPNWKKLIGSTCYKVKWSGTTLLMLDSANGFFGVEQLEWLEKEVKAAKGKLFVFTHANMFMKSMFDQQQFTDVRERARVVAALDGKCDIM